MMPTRQGSFRLFQVFGIDVFLHWSWFLVAVIMIQSRSDEYNSVLWNGLEYIGLFVIVLLHEFGHALACRSVGGQADQIVLWPLGGVAYVAAPPRPGPTLWSLAAGPLVNVVLFPLLTLILLLAPRWGWGESMPNLSGFITAMWYINLGLLIFNMLPIYPLDGGQILQSLLWFVVGRARSLMIASVVGIGGVLVLLALALYTRSFLLGIMSLFILMNCWQGFQQARVFLRISKLPRHSGLTCPHCRGNPLAGPFWRCQSCQAQFDLFESGGACPVCQAPAPTVQCIDCGYTSRASEWGMRPPRYGGTV